MKQENLEKNCQHVAKTNEMLGYCGGSLDSYNSHTTTMQIDRTQMYVAT